MLSNSLGLELADSTARFVDDPVKHLALPLAECGEPYCRQRF